MLSFIPRVSGTGVQPPEGAGFFVSLLNVYSVMYGCRLCIFFDIFKVFVTPAYWSAHK